MKLMLIVAVCFAAAKAQFFPFPPLQLSAKVVSLTIVNEDRTTAQSYAVVDESRNLTAYKFPADGLCLIQIGTPTENDTGKYKKFAVPESSSYLSSQQVGSSIASACQGYEYKIMSDGTTIEPSSRRYGYRMGGCSYYYGGYNNYPMYYAYPVYIPYYVPVPVPAPPPA